MVCVDWHEAEIFGPHTLILQNFVQLDGLEFQEAMSKNQHGALYYLQRG